MRLLTVLLQGCALLQYAAAKDAYLYTFNDEHRGPSTIPDTISANTAFAIASTRQGIADDMSLGEVDDQALLQISEYGGYQHPLFSEATSSDLPRVMVRIQTNKPETIEAAEKYPDFKIQRPTKDLLSLDAQKSGASDHSTSVSSKEGVRVACHVAHTAQTRNEEEVLLLSNGKPIAEILEHYRTYLSNIEDLVSASLDVDFTQSKVSQSTMTSQIKLLIEHLQIYASTSSYQPTLLILPPTSQLAASTNLITKRQSPEEEPLDLLPTSTPDLLSNPTPYKSNTTLPRRFPACFTSLSACNNATNSCSGHGSCKPFGSSKSCFQCKCTRTTIRTNKDGSKKTTLWAGAACQKKDISTEFTLFAVFGVTMGMLIMGVIGMMYSMGAQELPSVIGAGVAGPTAKK